MEKFFKSGYTNDNKQTQETCFGFHKTKYKTPPKTKNWGKLCVLCRGGKKYNTRKQIRGPWGLAFFFLLKKNLGGSHYRSCRLGRGAYLFWVIFTQFFKKFFKKRVKNKFRGKAGLLTGDYYKILNFWGGSHWPDFQNFFFCPKRGTRMHINVFGEGGAAKTGHEFFF